MINLTSPKFGLRRYIFTDCYPSGTITAEVNFRRGEKVCGPRYWQVQRFECVCVCVRKCVGAEKSCGLEEKEELLSRKALR